MDGVSPLGVRLSLVGAGLEGGGDGRMNVLVCGNVDGMKVEYEDEEEEAKPELVYCWFIFVRF